MGTKQLTFSNGFKIVVRENQNRHCFGGYTFKLFKNGKLIEKKYHNELINHSTAFLKAFHYFLDKMPEIKPKYKNLNNNGE
ncbi:MAG: hypothetical protein GY861_01140 [bacterium]|nr:hypothetical protein [bacterium]